MFIPGRLILFLSSILFITSQVLDHDERLIITLGQSNQELGKHKRRHGCGELKLEGIPCEIELSEVFISGRICVGSDSVILRKHSGRSAVIALGCITDYLKQDPESIELDAEVEVSMQGELEQWHLPAISAFGSSGSNAWDVTRGSSEIIVAIIDTGVDYEHPDLHPNIWINPAEVPGNGIDDDENGFVDDVFGFDFHNDDGDPMDDNGHGTHCAGIVGGVANISERISGVSPNVRIMSIKAMGENGSGKLSNVIAAVEYSLKMGAQITSNSFGTPQISYSAAFNRLLKVLEEAGQLYVAAAGNAGRNTDKKSEFPASLNSSIILSVAATNAQDQLASFSNYGSETVDLGAPGVKILSTKLNDRYGFARGTSTATPLVAATAALVLSTYHRQGQETTGRGQEVKEVILSSVDKVPGLEDKTSTGGRLNAAKAVEKAFGQTGEKSDTGLIRMRFGVILFILEMVILILVY